MPPQLSVITATWQRPTQLIQCLTQFQSQKNAGVQCEHVIVSDGPDPSAAALAQQWGARYFELPSQQGAFGAAAKDLGIQNAQGEFVCFWDDDNLYEPFALPTLFAAAYGADVAVLRTRHRMRSRPRLVTIPRRWDGEFRAGDIDTMCVCVRRDLAIQECWADGNTARGTDYRWFQKLAAHSPVIRYVPITIGYHL